MLVPDAEPAAVVEAAPKTPRDAHVPSVATVLLGAQSPTRPSLEIKGRTEGGWFEIIGRRVCEKGGGGVCWVHVLQVCVKESRVGRVPGRKEGEAGKTGSTEEQGWRWMQG